jgi:hypothetical protein
MSNNLINRRVTIINNSSRFYLQGGKIVNFINNQYNIVIDNGYNDLIVCNENDFRMFGN